MATFRANPNDEDEPWLEKAAIDGYGFRVWHLMFFAVSGFLSIMVFLACCVKVRIPRTKQDIQADYYRKKLANKFKERLKLIENQHMDSLDFQKALELIQQDYREDRDNLNNLYGVSVAQTSNNDEVEDQNSTICRNARVK